MRSAEFDRTEVLRAAMNIFIEKGYAKTSMQDLKKATGLHPGSIYCAFENKRGLLMAALSQYGEDSANNFQHHFREGDALLLGFKHFLDSVVYECERAEVRDCLLQKAMSELTKQDAEVEAYISGLMQQWHKGIACKLNLAQERGEISADRDIEALSNFVVMSIYGIRTFSHTHPTPGTITKLAEQIYQIVVDSAIAVREVK
ncbi:TetR/AcrR family transcriptional regulator [Thaumasiovibrio subtropicus]|uniref:TetR/AcrR family transcriptional regulator n=1 Tax=Thaumasiovibrio subtropicus TaxID=1891207 RepID=UPI000B34AE0F|nr:TetR/AcrR family transcriptional regulator [Thaumasiovibrio subtropicus]